MAKKASPNLSSEQVTGIFAELKKLAPPKRPSLSEILTENKDVISEAFKKGHSLRDIANFLSEKGLKTSYETLRKVADGWGITVKRNRKGNEAGSEVKHE